MRLYKILSILLNYPSAELMEHLGEMIELVPELEPASAADREALLGFLGYLKGSRLTKLQARYVETFDLNPDYSLHLTHHVFEEQDRDRGPTLVKLVEHFKASGYELAAKELPDYLPALLEYVSLTDLPNTEALLHQIRHAVGVIAENLERGANSYAPLLRLVERHGSAAVSRSA